ncbi:GNAT family N-acetyltransferase [Aquicoccus sp. SCR17]|nr:GNAT family N-acetyltransferase [Carideicomes alvinocaridis]
MKDFVHALKTEWLEGSAALWEICDEWQSLVDHTKADIYWSPIWTLTWWDHFGSDYRLLTFVARREDGRLAGLLPFMLRTTWAGPVPVRVARLAGADPQCVLIELPIEEDVLAPVLRRATEGLHSAFKVDLVSFTPVSGRGAIPEALRTALCGSSDHASAEQHTEINLVDKQAGTHTVFELPETFEGYLSTLSKKRRSQFRRDWTKLQENHGVKNKTDFANEQSLLDFVHLHDLQWRAAGRGGHFTDWPGSRDFYSDLSNRSDGDGRVRIEWMNGRDDTVAAQFCLVSNELCHWRLPARTIDEEILQLSAGKVALVLLIKNMIEGGVTRIEAGIGHYGYKLSYGGESVPTWRLITLRDSKVARLRLSILLGWARTIHVMYYRIWFCRAVPKLQHILPMRKKPLWKVWIRTRI